MPAYTAPETVGAVAGALHLPAQRSQLATARRYAEAAATAFGLDPERSYEFVYAVNEAVTNAIRHGAPDAQGLVHLSLATDANRLTLVVRDSGTFLRPVAGADDDPGHRRGLALMAIFTDEVRLCTRPGCTTVSLSKDRA
jgi:anti-sigma regulatory factor (Ser/Thr protein kinase)